MKKTLYLRSMASVALLIFSWHCIAQNNQIIDVSKVGRTELKYTLAKTDVRLEFVVRNAVKDDPKDANAYAQSIGKLFGRDDEVETVVSAIRVEWGSIAPYILSGSAFADLYRPNTAKLTKKNDNLVLEIIGGDGVVGYEVQLEMAPYGIVERRIHNRVSGYQEVTKYQHTEKSIQYVLDQLKKVK
jgi:hypothetical protein